MNPGPYRRLPQTTLSINNFHCGMIPDAPKQSTIGTQPFGSIPRAHPDQHFMTPISSVPDPGSNYNLHNPLLSMAQPNVWDDSLQVPTSFEDHNLSNYFGYSPPFPGNDNETSFPRGAIDYGVPRFIPNEVSMDRFNENSMLDVYEPPAYVMDSSRRVIHNQHGSVDRSTIGYNPLDSSREFARLSISHSPVPSHEHDDMAEERFLFERPSYRLPSSETSEDGGLSSREMTAIDGDDHTAEEPYAKLIHRALMSTPNHSMVLQEIYQWFRENTSKGSSDSKGWMNSIRHNLSMNAAFKKTERKVVGDETKKSTEWVLEDFAIKDGVQSTTRYRKGTGAKKFIKNDHPATARQASGRQGGIITRQTNLRRRVKGELPRSRRSTQTIFNGRRGVFQDYQEMARTAQRHTSPLTPPSVEHHASGPYLYDTDNFSLGDVQGVYLDDPLFSNSSDSMNFPNAHTLAAQRFG